MSEKFSFKEILFEDVFKIMNTNLLYEFENYSGIRLINPRLINPAAYCIQFAWNGIVPILSRYKNFG